MEIRHIAQTITRESSEEDLRYVEAILGPGVIKKKFEPLVFNLEHVGVRIHLATIATLLRVARRHGLDAILAQQILEMELFVPGSAFLETVERYLALAIVEAVGVEMTEVLPEHKVFGDKNPDWTIRSAQLEDLHVEVSAITIGKAFEDLQSFGGRLQTAKTIAIAPVPVYFEVVFEDNPRAHDANAIGHAIVDLAKAGRFPVHTECDGVAIMVDSLASRHTRSQLISDELSSMGLAKMTRLLKNELAYTLAVRINLKTVDAKISEKKKSNALDRIGNVWLCLFVHEELETLIQDVRALTALRRRIARSKWLKRVILASLFQDTEGHWDLRYVVIDGE